MRSKDSKDLPQNEEEDYSALSDFPSMYVLNQ